MAPVNGNIAPVDALTEQLRQDPGLPVASSTKAYWQEPPTKPVSDRQSPQLPSDTDVVIIGSGITGCSVARRLLQGNANLRLTMLEARRTTSGATGRNGGHIKAVPEVSYAELLPVIGKERAREVVHFTLKNVEELFCVAESLSTESRQYSEVRPVESLNIFTDQGGFDHVKGVVEQFEADVPEFKGRARLVTKEELVKKYGVKNAAGGLVSQAGAAWPYRLVTGILSDLLEAYGRRFSIETATPAQSIDFDKDTQKYLVQTSRGSISAATVIHATNGHAGHLLPGLRGALFPVRGQMTAQVPTKSFGNQGSKQSWSIHYESGFDYITQSGRSGEIFIGGALVSSDPLKELGNPRDDTNSIRSMAHLGGIMDATFGSHVREEVKASWTGVMGFTVDGLPLVGKLPSTATSRDGENEFVAAGYNGYGMPNAWLCGQHIADLVLGKEEPEQIPSAYHITEARLQQLDAAHAAEHWLQVFGKI